MLMSGRAREGVGGKRYDFIGGGWRGVDSNNFSKLQRKKAGLEWF